MIYKENSATVDEIYGHLMKCDSSFLPPLSIKVDIHQYSKKIEGHAVMFEAWLDRELIGLIAAYINDENLQCAYITNVSVLPTFSGKGIGAALLKQCIERVQELSYKAIELEVSEGNRRAIQLYEKFGFVFSGSKDASIVMTLNL